MTYDVASVRLWSQMTASRIFREVAEGKTAETSPSSASAGSLADLLFAQDEEAESEDDTSLSAMIASLRTRIETDEAAESDSNDGDVKDLSSKAFMKALQDKILTLKESSETAAMADAMLKAVASGNLVVTDAAAGAQILAWDPTSEKAVPRLAVTSQSEWGAFLKEHLARDSNGRYARNEDTSHKDKAAGVSAYFGMIGETYYYLSWRAVATAKA